ncbi:MAG: hypothetical protein IKE85_07115 [Mogibacterium sp.]|nr:hypothetical protein [Mogibacterium sp.]MBR2540579.1 hypothetical protein [Mogibacterium sp.]
MSTEAAETNFAIPREVYYRCIWTVRDARRLEHILGICRSDDCDPKEDFGRTEWTGIVNGEIMARAEADLDAINTALDKIPDVYRRGIILNITEGQTFSELAHPNTWKKWKKIFIYQLAQELHLI